MVVEEKKLLRKDVVAPLFLGDGLEGGPGMGRRLLAALKPEPPMGVRRMAMVCCCCFMLNEWVVFSTSPSSSQRAPFAVAFFLICVL